MGHVCRNEEFIELQVPPDAGNGTANAGGPTTSQHDHNMCLQLRHACVGFGVCTAVGSGSRGLKHALSVLCVVCAGVSLARLLWHVPVPAMVTLIASLLLERRVLVVGQSRDMVSAAVCAAQALIHPFR